MPTPKENKVANPITAQAILQKVQEKQNNPETPGIEVITSKVSQTEHDRIIASLYEKIKELKQEKMDADFSTLSPDPAQKKVATEESDRLAREIAEIEVQIKNNYRVANQLAQFSDQITNLRKARSEQIDALAAAQSELKFATGFDLDPETETARNLTERAKLARKTIENANKQIAEIDTQIEKLSQRVRHPDALDFAPIDAAIAQLESALDDNAPQPAVKNYAGMVDSIDRQIAELRQHDFDYSMAYKDDEGLTRTLYIKDHTKPGTNPDAEKDPIHPDTAQIAALQYLKGMLLIASNIDDKAVSEKMLVEINDAFKKYSEKTKIDINEQAEETRLLVEDFAGIISSNLNVKLKKAHKQVAMGRDIGLLLTPPPAVCTITSHKDKDGKETVVAELARPIKIGQLPDKDAHNRNYYQKHFQFLHKQHWFQSASKRAGLDPATGWMTNLFTTHYNDIARFGVAAPPSARWLPTPSGSQLIDNYLVQKDSNGEIVREMDHQFVRMGITSAFEIKSEKEQKKLAQEQIKEIMRIQLQQAIANYEKTYAAMLEKPKNGLSPRGNQKPKEFFISYQTLLSPFYIEARGYSIPLLGKALHRDNNAKFVEMAKKAVREIAKEYADKPYPSTSSGETYNLQFTHTNSAINKRADTGLIRKFEKTHTKALNLKFDSVADMIDAMLYKKYGDSIDRAITPADTSLRNLGFYIRNGGENPGDPEASAILALENYVKNDLRNPALATEMITRIRAAYNLRALLNNDKPYNEIEMPAYKRNLMKASLEACMLGAQALHLKGCKSARDRTAIAAGALRTMLIDPETMKDPTKLMEGVMRSLKEGHHFRAMLYHNPIVKVGDVHKDLEKLLPDKLKFTARRLLVFCNKFKKKKHKENQKTILEEPASVQQQQTTTKEKEDVQQANATKEPAPESAKKPKFRTRLKTMVVERSKGMVEKGKKLGKAQIARLKGVKDKIKASKSVHATLTFFKCQLAKTPVLNKVIENFQQRRIKNK